MTTEPGGAPNRPYCGLWVTYMLSRQLAKAIGAFSEEPFAPSGDNENAADPDFEKEYRLRGRPTTTRPLPASVKKPWLRPVMTGTRRFLASIRKKASPSEMTTQAPQTSASNKPWPWLATRQAPVVSTSSRFKR